MFVEKFAKSHWGQDLFLFGDEARSGPKLFLLGGVHGNEPEGVWLCKALISRLQDLDLYWRAIPEFNPDGLSAVQRLNGNGVDLNRNLPTKDWSKEAFSEKYPPGEQANSEPETQALVKFLDDHSFDLVLSFHSFERFLLNINGDCREFAEAVSQKNAYPIEESIGYPTPGCLGTYTGLERGMPTVTYEIERGSSVKKVLDQHLEAVLEALKDWKKRNS